MRTTTCGTSNQCPTGYFCPYSAGICCPQPQPARKFSLNYALINSLFILFCMVCFSEKCAPRFYFSFPFFPGCSPTSRVCRSKFHSHLIQRACSEEVSHFQGCPDGVQSLTTRCFYDSDCPTGFNCPPMTGFCCRSTMREFRRATLKLWVFTYLVLIW